MRAPAIFTAWSNILAAHIIVTGGNIHWSPLLLLLLSSSALFSAGMVLNDCFDYHTDLKERPERPIPSGKVSLIHAVLFSCLLLITGIVSAALVSIQSVIIALLIMSFIFLYNGVLKQTIAGSLAMAACRYFNWLLGFSLLPFSELSLLLPITIFLYIISLTLLSQEEEQAKNKTTVLLTISGIILSGFSIIAIATLIQIKPGWESLIILFGVIFIVQHLWQTYTHFTPKKIQSSIHLLLLAIIPLDAVMVMIFASSWWALTILILLLPGKFLARVMYIT